MEIVYEYIDNNVDRMIAELFKLLLQPSISSQGIGIEECADLLSGMMKDVGIRTKILHMGGPNNPPLVYGDLYSPDAEKTLLI